MIFFFIACSIRHRVLACTVDWERQCSFSVLYFVLNPVQQKESGGTSLRTWIRMVCNRVLPLPETVHCVPRSNGIPRLLRKMSKVWFYSAVEKYRTFNNILAFFTSVAIEWATLILKFETRSGSMWTAVWINMMKMKMMIKKKKKKNIV